MNIVSQDIQLEHLWVVYPGDKTYPLLINFCIFDMILNKLRGSVFGGQEGFLLHIVIIIRLLIIVDSFTLFSQIFGLRMLLNIRNNHGFTWIELIVVMVIMGIISAVIISTMATSNNELIAATESVKAHLRYAQSRAMSTSSNWYFQFDAAPSPGQYTLFQVGKGSRVFPGESTTTLPLEKGMTLNGTPIVLFDHLGRPFTDTAGTVAQSGIRTIITSAAGNIDIKPETGFIP